MVKLTLIARVTDGLPLAEGLDDGRDLKDAEFYKQQVKALFKNLSRGQNEASRMSIETGPYVFQYPDEFIMLLHFYFLCYCSSHILRVFSLTCILCTWQCPLVFFEKYAWISFPWRH